MSKYFRTGGVLNTSSTLGGVVRPSMVMNFDNGERLHPLFSCIRNSIGTYYDSLGVLRTKSAGFPRIDHDPVTLLSKGLLIEEQRTNLLLQSQDFATTWAASGTGPAVVTANTTTSLDGTVNADTVSGTATNSDRVQQTVTVAASTTYVISFFVKNSTSLQSRFHVANPNSGTTNSDTYITWSGSAITGFINQGTTVGVAVAYPNNWWRVYFAFTTNASDAGTATVRFYPNTTGGDATYKAVFLWGAQLEAGAFPTSYIPTTTTALTRNADVATVNTLSPWFNSASGTLYAETQLLNTVAQNRAGFDLNDGGTNNRNVFRAFTTGSADQNVVRSGGSTVAALAAATNPTTAVRKSAAAYAVNDFAFTADGGTPATDTLGAVPVGLTTFLLGSAVAGTEYLNGYLRRIVYYPRRLSNAELQSITS